MYNDIVATENISHMRITCVFVFVCFVKNAFCEYLCNRYSNFYVQKKKTRSVMPDESSMLLDNMFSNKFVRVL